MHACKMTTWAAALLWKAKGCALRARRLRGWQGESAYSCQEENSFLSWTAIRTRRPTAGFGLCLRRKPRPYRRRRTTAAPGRCSLTLTAGSPRARLLRAAQNGTRPGVIRALQTPYFKRLLRDEIQLVFAVSAKARRSACRRVRFEKLAHAPHGLPNQLGSLPFANQGRVGREGGNLLRRRSGVVIVAAHQNQEGSLYASHEVARHVENEIAPVHPVAEGRS